MLFGGVRQAGDEMRQYQDWMREDDLGVKVRREDYSQWSIQSKTITDSELVFDSTDVFQHRCKREGFGRILVSVFCVQ